MRLSYNWLQELVPNLSASPEEVAEKLTMHAYETSVLSKYSIDPLVRVMKVDKLEPHPKADRLRLATITDGQKTSRLVCGAANIAEGQIVAFGPPGALVHDKDGASFTIKEAIIKREPSPGMILSARELGLGWDHSGIFILPPGVNLGASLADHIPADTILEAKISPNRAHDSLSHLGVAREIAALLKLTMPEPSPAVLPNRAAEVDGFTLDIENASDAPRYMNIVLCDVQLSSPPLWLLTRLLISGLRPINAVVDITNYVLLECGQPSHAFDMRKLPGKKTGIRRARAGESLTLLNGNIIGLPPGAIIVASQDEPIALAGIMGGLKTQFTENSQDLILEIANFRAHAIYEAAAALEVNTEASYRFAKGISPWLVGHAAARLAHLLKEITGATVAGVLEYYPAPVTPVSIKFSPAKVSAVAGMSVTLKDSRQALESLGCQIDAAQTVWRVTPPFNRLDLTGEHDLREEVIRLLGLTDIPTYPATSPAIYPPPLQASLAREKIRDILIARGLTETYNVSFEPAKLGVLFDPDSQRIEISNPLAPEQARLRVSLLPGLAVNFMTNKDDFHKTFSGQTRALFEIGNVFRQTATTSTRVAGINEEEHIAGLLVGNAAEAKSIVEEILMRLNCQASSAIVIFAGKVSPAIVAHLKYRLPLAAFVINASILYRSLRPLKHLPASLAELKRNQEPALTYEPFSRYPSVFRDLSFLVDENISVEHVQELIERAGGKLVSDSELFDELTPSDLAELPAQSNRNEEETKLKGLAFHIEYQAADRTLSADEVASVHNRIILALEEELGVYTR